MALKQSGLHHRNYGSGIWPSFPFSVTSLFSVIILIFHIYTYFDNFVHFFFKLQSLLLSYIYYYCYYNSPIAVFFFNVKIVLYTHISRVGLRKL